MASAALLVVVVTAVVVFFAKHLRARARRPTIDNDDSVVAAPSLVIAGWLWFLGMLVPVLGFVAVGSNAIADRYTYLPHLGLFLAIAAAIGEAAARSARTAPESGALDSGSSDSGSSDSGSSREVPRIPSIPRIPRIPPNVLAIVVVLAAIAMIPRTIAQISVWENTLTLFQHAATVEPDSAYAHFRLADAYLERGDPQRGLQHAARAAELLPDDPEIIERLGLLLLAVGNRAEAERALLAVVEMYPARKDAWRLLAQIARDDGRVDEANRREQRARAR